MSLRAIELTGDRGHARRPGAARVVLASAIPIDRSSPLTSVQDALAARDAASARTVDQGPGDELGLAMAPVDGRKPRLAEKEQVAKLARRVKATLRKRGRVAAIRKALDGSAELLAAPSDALRFKLRQAVFARFALTGLSSYQINDFECFDYDLFDIADDLPTFRGPAPRMKDYKSGRLFLRSGRGADLRPLGRQAVRRLAERRTRAAGSQSQPRGRWPRHVPRRAAVAADPQRPVRHTPGHVRPQRRMSRLSRRTPRRVRDRQKNCSWRYPAAVVGAGPQDGHSLCASVERDLFKFVSSTSRKYKQTDIAAMVFRP